ncbi:MAG: trigger factor, partial [Clostridiales bacterium]|nr:trigger factor [Clostridiales bacterium]
EGFREGVPFDGGKGENYPLELGSHSFIPGFEDQLIGVKAGEEREINVVFPEGYQEKTLAGQPVLFKVQVRELKRRIWPDLDDELAQELSEKAETLEDLRREVAERIKQRNDAAAERKAREDVLSLATTNAGIDLPPLMTEQRVDSMVQHLAERLQSQGLQMQQYLEYAGQTAQDLRESYMEQAEKAVRNDLVLEAVAQAEDISVSNEELEQELQTIAEYYQQPPEQIKAVFSENGRLDALTEEMRIRKASELIYSSADVTEVIISGEAEETGDIVDAD